MTNGAYGTTGAGAAMAAIANAIKASGAIVRLEPQDFLDILARVAEPLVVYSPSGLLTRHKYLTSYKGLVFFAASKQLLPIPESAEIIHAKKIWVPDM
ncbi:MAG: hypothetical protein DRP65_06395 [Planctomycetota bacterium]|nr:MAG: hypothetical protein DRP65_06395 [Planctomycetota bacterium]